MNEELSRVRRDLQTMKAATGVTSSFSMSDATACFALGLGGLVALGLIQLGGVGDRIALLVFGAGALLAAARVWGADVRQERDRRKARLVAAALAIAGALGIRFWAEALDVQLRIATGAMCMGLALGLVLSAVENGRRALMRAVVMGIPIAGLGIVASLPNDDARVSAVLATLTGAALVAGVAIYVVQKKHASAS